MTREERRGKRKTRDTFPKRVPDLGYYYIVTDTKATEENYLYGLRDSLPEKIHGRLVIKVRTTSTDNLVSTCKGESDGDDLSDLSDDAIWERLKDRIYDSSVTVIFISPGMRESSKTDKEQWIPGEVSYYLEPNECCSETCVTYHRDILFEIIKKNKFNIKEGDKRICDASSTIWSGACSYIKAVRWKDFIGNYRKYIDAACEIQNNIDYYEIYKEV